MGRRYTCDIDGLADNWVEVDERWTLAEVRAHDAAQTIDEIRAWWAKKITACHIEVGDAVIDSPTELAGSSFDDADWRLYGFLGGVLNRALTDLRLLGNRSGRLLSPSSAARTEAKA